MKTDEGIRPNSSMETLGKLKPAFAKDGTGRTPTETYDTDTDQA